MEKRNQLNRQRKSDRGQRMNVARGHQLREISTVLERYFSKEGQSDGFYQSYH